LRGPRRLRVAMIRRIRDWLAGELWNFDSNAPVTRRLLRSTAQLIALTVRGFQSDQLLLRASALTYITALSLVPMLGVVISVLGVVGVDQTIVNFAIDQVTTVAPEARETLRGYAAGLDFQGFGTIGGAIVFGTSIFALRHLEATMNDIWGVARSRGWARRFSDYLAVMIVGPISIGVAVSLATTLHSEPLVSRMLSVPFFEQIYGFGLLQVPLLVLFLGFTFLYWFFPNTTVQIRAAALGGLVAAILFLAARTIYVDFQVGAATYQAVFGALSAIPLILVWLYACWAVLLLGAEVAFATQNLPFARREMRAGDDSPAHREAIAVELAVAIARSFLARDTPPTASALADTLDEPIRLVRRLVGHLEAADLVRGVEIGDRNDRSYVPARPARDLTLADVLRAVRGEWEPDFDTGTTRRSENVATVLVRLEGALKEIADRTSLETLAREGGNSTPGDAA
jgi:membrane protein